MKLKIIDYNSKGEGVAKLDGFVYFVPYAKIGEEIETKVAEMHESYGVCKGIVPVTDCEHFGVCGGCDLLHMSYEEELEFKSRKVVNALRLEKIEVIASPKIYNYRNKITLHDGGMYEKKSHKIIKINKCLLGELKERNKIQKLFNYEFEVNKKSFFQVNNGAFENIIEFILQFIHGVVLDLYCGVGTIGICVAKNAEKVIGVEINEPAVANARVNAIKNGIKNIEFNLMPSEDFDLPNCDVVILDPPRKGCDKKLIEKLNNSEIDRIIYISCNAAILARDLKGLNNYELKVVRGFDMFPRTSHVEVVCVLEREI